MYDTEAEIKAQVGKTKGDTLIEEVFAAFMRGDMFPQTPRIGFVGPTDRTCCWLLTIKEFNKINGMRPCIRLKTALLAKPHPFTVRDVFSYHTVAHLRKKPIPRALNVVK